MKTTARIRLTVLGGLTAGAIVVLPGAPLAQQAPPPQQAAPPPQAPPNPNQAAFAAAQAALQEAATADRKDMMDKLGDQGPPSPSGNEAGPITPTTTRRSPTLRISRTCSRCENARKVTTPAMVQERRPRIVEGFPSAK